MYNAEHLTAASERRMVDYDIDDALNLVDLVPGAADKCLPIATFRKFLAGVFRSVAAGALSKFQIIAATDAAGTGATIVVEHALGDAPDAVGDTVWLECDADQIREALATATHVGVRLQLAAAADECVVFFERAEPYFPQAGLTADYVA